MDWIQWKYTQVVEPERLVCLMSTTDANWQIATNPRMPDWPRTLLTTVTFEQIGIFLHAYAISRHSPDEPQERGET